jgi:prophage regulatory protein
MRFMRWREVLQTTGLSESTLRRLEGSDQFPRRRQLSTGSVGWLEEDVKQWVRSRDDIENGESAAGGGHE